MKTCPKCGNKYRPDIDVCPNDGAQLSGVEPSPAPPPPRAAKARPKPAAISYEGEARSLTDRSSAGSWLFALLACALLFAGFLWARSKLLAPEAAAGIAEAEEAGQDAARKKKRKKGKRRRKKSRSNGPGASSDSDEFAEYDWEQDYQDDNQVFGDVLSQTDYVEEEEVAPPEPEAPYEPTTKEWRPSGSYSPVAKFGNTSPPNVVEIDLGKASVGSPMDEVDVRNVLDVRRLMPCYHRWVQKIPQMRGRVWMTFAVAPDGTVKGLRITRSELRSRVVEQCIVDSARRFRFPRASDGRTTRFDTHFNFTNR